MKINKELMKGSTTVLILKLLENEDMYGYQITQELKKRSVGAIDMKEGTLYPTLHALEKAGAVEAYWFDTEEGRRRKYYKLTDEGREQLNEKQKEWSMFTKAINSVIGGDDYALQPT